ncbi:MAG: type III pantothenate kinase [Clostridiales bacterium]|nr:type III pantothenate kinase [Clostridiales bacterium]
MILTLDIGNTNIKTGLFNGPEMVCYWRISTNRLMTSDECGILLANLFAHNRVRMDEVTGIAISSVVPPINFTIEHMCRNYFGLEPMMVAPGIRTGINIKYENPRELGSDRIANAVAAYELYGGPCIFIDFGTATTFGVMSAKGEFLGGAICPGLKLGAEALVERTARLPRIELVKPESAIGRNTVSNLQSGIVFGYVGQVTYLIQKMKRELGAPGVKVIATGGLGLLVAGETDAIDVLDGLLTLKGLRLIYEKNVDLGREEARA